MLPVTPYAYPAAHKLPDGARNPRDGARGIRNLPGPILLAAGIVSIALTLTAAGYGELAWSVLCGLTGALCLRFGISLTVVEQRRIKAAKAQDTAFRGDI
ncbi:hypothetical protein AB0I30_30840 [Nocardia tengchongensis]|uniref:hypothetical protein n=1 Tax=Nocardia tengchongensis TaxID=2055889 RepID=UPI0033F49886